MKMWAAISVIAAVIAVVIWGILAVHKKNTLVYNAVTLVLTALGIIVPLISFEESKDSINTGVHIEGDATSPIVNIGSGENNTVIYSDYSNSAETTSESSYIPPDFYPAFEQVERLPMDALSCAGNRKAYTLEEVNGGAMDGRIVFNSISDSDIGHEFDFVGARINTGKNQGAKNIWASTAIKAEENTTYLVRLYVHNNSRWREDVAEDVSIRFLIEDTKAVTENDIALKGVNSGYGYYAAAVYGFIYASTAEPSEYRDGVKFVSDRPFHLEYIPGTALYENRGIGSRPGYRLSNEIVSSGVSIGFAAMDGRIPGCYAYSSFTTILVMPVFEKTE